MSLTRSSDDDTNNNEMQEEEAISYIMHQLVNQLNQGIQNNESNDPNLFDSSNLPAPAIEIEEKAENKQLLSLSDQMKNAAGSWLTSMRDYMTLELEAIISDAEEENAPYTFDDIKQALTNLLTGKVENFTANAKLVIALKNIQEMLVITQQSPLYTSMMQRDMKQHISSSLYVYSALQKLHEVAKEKLKDFELEQSQKVLDEQWNQFSLSNYLCYLPYKQYEHEELTTIFDQLCSEYKINVKDTDIFEHTLLNYFRIPDFSHYCKFGPHFTNKDGYLLKHDTLDTITLSLSAGVIQKFIIHLNNYSSEFNAELTPVNIKEKDVKAISLKINPIVKLVLSDEFKKFFHQRLANKQLLDSYQMLCTKKNITPEAIRNLLIEVTNAYQLNPNSAPQALLHAYKIESNSKELGSIKVPERYDGYVTEMDFLLPITAENALILVQKINAEFSEAARFIEPVLADKPFFRVAIKSDVIKNNTNFIAVIQKGLQEIVDHDHDQVEIIEVADNKRKFTTKDMLSTLRSVAVQYQNNETKDTYLANKLNEFATAIENHQPKEELDQKSYKVTRAIALHESAILTASELSIFKKSDKHKIKDIQKEVHKVAELSKNTLKK